MKISKKKTGNRIRDMMINQGLTVAQLQNKLDLDSPQAIYKWINGINLPTVEHLHGLGRIFGAPIEEILVIEEGDKKDD